LKSNRSDDDGTAEAAPYDDGTAKAVPYEDSTAKAVPYEDSTAKALPYGDGTAEAVPYEGGAAEAMSYEDAAVPPRELADALARARPRLGRLASSVLLFPTVGSTNDVALAHSAKASAERSRSGERSEGLVVVADQQTAGRGRRGHTWFSPPGAGLYVSVVLAPTTARVDPARATMLTTLSAGVALAEGIAAATGLRVDLKWPNDLHVSRRKLAGILAEASADETVVLGCGINVAATAFPPELRDRATSLESELGRAVDRAHVLVEMLAALSRRYEDLLAGRFDAILDAWRQHAPAASGARVSWTTNAGVLSGITAGIDEGGALLVKTADRVERIVAGEVNWT
jgi:BirA family biotin operon repressor/biotin-[acetyl-CoA-carboxylase] ligase